MEMECITISCALMGLIIGWYWFRKQKKDMEERRGVPKGRLGWPIIGETLEFISSGLSSRPVSFMDKRKSLYGQVFKTNILGTPIIVSTDVDVNKVVLQNHGNIFVPAYPKCIRELFGEKSIFQTNGYLQKKVHALIGGYMRSPQFKTRVTKDIENAVKITLASWMDKDVVFVQEETTKIAFQVLVKALMSVGPGDEFDFIRREFTVFTRGMDMLWFPFKIPGSRLYKSLKAKEKLLKLVNDIIDERKLAMEKMGDCDEVNESPIDAIDVLLRDKDVATGKPSVPLDFLSGNIVEMMIPGEETVPTVMTIAVHFLSHNPIALARITEENMALKRQKADSSDNYTWTDYMSLTFTQNVINETMRMANIINGVWRKALKDVEIKGYLIPKGWSILASFISIHMDEEIYEHPYRFDPWRWEKTGAAVNSNCFTPFGGGQRLCSGLELARLEIAIFLHHFVATCRWAAEKDDLVYFPTVKMRRKLPITVSSQT